MNWIVLVTYTLVAGMSQLLWLNFAPLLSTVQQRYGVSELMASTLVLVFPLLYVFFSLPAGKMIDRRGYKVTIAAGAIAQALFACLRIWDSSFWVLLVGQVGIALAQPFVVNGVSKLVSDWFPERQGALATGIATIGMFAGMAIAMAATPALVEAFSLRLAMVVFGAVAVAAAALFVFAAREAWSRPAPQSRVALRSLLTRDLVLLFSISFFAGFGFFNGLTTWLEEILAPNGINAVSAGLVGGVLIAAGVVGAGVIPWISDMARRRKPLLILCGLASLAIVYPMCTGTRLPWVMMLGGLLGFFFLPAYALLLEMCTSSPAKRRRESRPAS